MDRWQSRTTAVRASVAAAALGLSLASAAWIVPASWPTYAVFFAFAFAFSFVWLDSAAPTSVPYMATATAFVYIAGFPILFFELVARVVAYPMLFAAARRGWIILPRPLRAGAARLDLAAMLGVATIGLAVRVVVVQLAPAVGIESPIALIAVGEPTAYAVMGTLSAVLPLPTREYVVTGPLRLPAEDERVDVIFSAVFIVPFVVLLIRYGHLEHGLIGAAAWSLTSLAPHALVQLLIRRRHLLDERRVELERKQQEIEHFAYTVAHDLKDPLTAITIMAASALDAHRDALPEPMRENLASIRRRATETEKMIAGLLRMVRIVSEPEAVGTVDLGTVTAGALEVLGARIAARNVRVDVAAPLPVIPGQESKLRHVVANLVGNALRFVPPGTGAIGVSATREDGSVVLAVRDNGVGIPAQYHDAIFEMFRRVPDADQDGDGSGMGLAIVKRIVEAHGGDVWVESTPGAGSVFRVRLPAGERARAGQLCVENVTRVGSSTR